jgi:hypothetical protein
MFDNTSVIANLYKKMDEFNLEKNRLHSKEFKFYLKLSAVSFLTLCLLVFFNKNPNNLEVFLSFMLLIISLSPLIMVDKCMNTYHIGKNNIEFFYPTKNQKKNIKKL